MKFLNSISNQTTVHFKVQGMHSRFIFQYSTRVKERVDGQSISKYGLMLSEFDEILSQVTDANYLVANLSKYKHRFI